MFTTAAQLLNVLNAFALSLRAINESVVILMESYSKKALVNERSLFKKIKNEMNRDGLHESRRFNPTFSGSVSNSLSQSLGEAMWRALGQQPLPMLESQ